MCNDTRYMKSLIHIKMMEYIEDYKKEHALITNWKQPLIGFADAKGTYFQSLKTIISPTHYMPQDFLADCTVVLSYFLPFEEEIGYRNKQGQIPDPTWITAYLETNQLFLSLNDYLTNWCKKMGYCATVPRPTGMIDKEHIYSNWSQRHIAFAAGLGTFGLNNMLITEQGTCGRLNSLVTNLPVCPDHPLKEERCLYKKYGICGVCITQCPANAFMPNNAFDRRICETYLTELERRLGGDACGKCVVGLPCTYQTPKV